MSRFAASTTTTVANSRAEIERILKRYGCSAFSFGWDTAAGIELIQFRLHDRQIRLRVDKPAYEQISKESRRAAGTLTKDRQTVIEAAHQQKWRATVLYVKAICEAIESRVVTVDQAFLPFVVLPTGQTISEWAGPQLERFQLEGREPLLLPQGSES